MCMTGFFLSILRKYLPHVRIGCMALVSASIDKMLLDGLLCSLNIESGKCLSEKTKECGMYRVQKIYSQLSTTFRQSTRPISYGLHHILRWIGSVKFIEYRSESYNPFQKTKGNNSQR